jgi:hypothetical protein
MVAPGRKADNLGDFLQIYMESRGGISHCPQFMQGHSNATLLRTNIKFKKLKKELRGRFIYVFITSFHGRLNGSKQSCINFIYCMGKYYYKT